MAITKNIREGGEKCNNFYLVNNFVCSFIFLLEEGDNMRTFIVSTLVFSFFLVPSIVLSKPNPELPAPKQFEIYTVCVDVEESAPSGGNTTTLAFARSECIDAVDKTTNPEGRLKFSRGILRPVVCEDAACEKQCEETQALYGCYGVIRPL